MLTIISGHSNRGTGDTDPPLEMGPAAPWRRGQNAGFPAPESPDLPTPTFLQGCAVLVFLAVVVIAGIVVWHAQSTPATQVNISPAPTDIPGPSPTETPTPPPTATPAPAVPPGNVPVSTAESWAMAYEKNGVYSGNSGSPELTFAFSFIGPFTYTRPTLIGGYYWQATCVTLATTVKGTDYGQPYNEQDTTKYLSRFYWDGASHHWVPTYHDIGLITAIQPDCSQVKLAYLLPSADEAGMEAGPNAVPMPTPQTSP